RHNNVNVAELFDRWTGDSAPAGVLAERPAASRVIADSIMTRLRGMESVTQRLVADGNAFVSQQVDRLATPLFGCLAMIGSAAFAIFLAKRRIVTSLRALGKSIGQLENGDAAIEVQIDGDDEFTLLARTLAEMSARVARSHGEVIAANRQLAQVA